MKYFQLYIGVDKEVRKYIDNINITSADVTYWLNKALDEFINTRYRKYEQDEESREDLRYLYAESTLTPEAGTESLMGTSVAYNFDLSALSYRFITNERATISFGGATKIVSVKPVTKDQFNIKINDPFSEHVLHLQNAIPLKLDREVSSGGTTTSISLISDGNYSITDYKLMYIMNPTKFVILDAGNTSDYTDLSEKASKELITISTRMIIENLSNPRYNTISAEEMKQKL